MATLLRVKARWSGFPGAPGYSIFHFGVGAVGDGGGSLADDAAAASAGTAVTNFFSAIKAVLPGSVTVQTESDVELVESTTGELVGFASAGAQAVQVGTGPGGFSAPSGAVVTWRTAGVRKGRRMRGRTFLVPLTSSAYDATGTLVDATRTTLNTAATALMNANTTWQLGVFGRPSGPAATDGQYAKAISATVPDMAALLSSRRQ